MKRLTSLLLIVSFLGIVAFGTTLFGMGANHSSGCFASVVDGKPCPSNIVDLGMHHISALETIIGTAQPQGSQSALLLASIFLVSFSLFLLNRQLLFPKIELLQERFRDLSLVAILEHQKNISWLSLFEHSPAL